MFEISVLLMLGFTSCLLRAALFLFEETANDILFILFKKFLVESGGSNCLDAF
jgi:hypothetical protein